MAWYAMVCYGTVQYNMAPLARQEVAKMDGEGKAAQGAEYTAGERRREAS